MAPFLASVTAVSSVLAICLAIAVDDPNCYQQFFDLRKSNPNDPRLYYDRDTHGSIIETNYTMVTLSACNQACGMAANGYSFWDVQQRVATLIVPLFILIGSMHFVPLGIWNAVQVTAHLLADPINSFRCLLSKLATYQWWYNKGQRCMELPTETRKDIAMIMMAYDAWQEISSCRVGHQIEPPGEEVFEALKNWLRESPQVPEIKRLARLDACRTAAYELADCRASGLSKTLIGTVNYVIIIGASLVHVYNGDFNNRTGHSIAFAMLYSWLIPTVLLSSMVGGFNSKSSSKAILDRLYTDLTRIEPDSDNPAHAMTVPQLSPFASVPGESLIAVYESLPWCGANYTFAPRQSCWGRRNPISITVAASVPTLLAMLSAVFMSYTNPTVGIGCRSVQQFCFYVAWIVSAIVTYYIQFEDDVHSAAYNSQPSSHHEHHVHHELLASLIHAQIQTPEDPTKPSTEHAEQASQPPQRAGVNANANGNENANPPPHRLEPKRQWRQVLIKDVSILVPQVTLFLAGFCGWFNSCFCWSAWFSRLGNAHVVLDPQETIRALARRTWPLLTLLPILGHLSFVLGIWIVFRRGAGLFSVVEEERYKDRDYVVPVADDGLSRASTALLPLTARDEGAAGSIAAAVEGESEA